MIEIPVELALFQLPVALQNRLRFLLDKQDSGNNLTEAEKQEAEGLVNIAKFLSLLQLCSRRVE